MKITMVIPTYWGRERKIGWKKGDAVYDHPTPLDSEGTLKRAMESIKILKDKDFELAIIAAATAEDIEERVEEKVLSIVESENLGIEVIFFSHSKLREVQNFFIDSKKKDYAKILKLRGYSNIRNLCLLVPHILSSDVVVLIDDDEVFEDPEFIGEVKEFIGKKVNGEKILAVAGYYLQSDGNYRLKQDFQPWMQYWDKLERMNEAFEKIIGRGQRLKETPFVFGGNMVIHKELYKRIPFDPEITRGEDIDYLINARMFGIRFYLDRELSMKHLPPKKPHSTWRNLREDIYRFIYEREKLRKQEKLAGMMRVKAEDFDPYPGAFLKDSLEEKIYRASEILALEYLIKEERENASEALNNIRIAKENVIPRHNPFQGYLSFKKLWEGMMNFTEAESMRKKLKNIIIKK